MGLTRSEDGWRHSARALGRSRRMQAAGGMGDLLVRTVRVGATRPFSWWADCLEIASLAIRRSFLPLLCSAGAFSIGLVVVFFAGIVQRLGTLDRTGGAFQIGFNREIAVWVCGMVVAGVVGGAITADLGARKIRDELDALAVLGVDQVRSLVVPRVVGLAIALPILGMLSLLICQVSSYLGLIAVYSDHVTSAGFGESYWAFTYSADLWYFIAKFALFGVFIGVVSCYKGLHAEGGTEGVGRAVNECVLVTFFGIWLFHTVTNLAFLSVFPDVLALRG